MLKNIFLKEPLTHFLIAGAVLFIALSAIKPPANEDSIIVDRAALLSFIQYRSKAFEPHAADSLLDSMNDDELQRLTQDYIREEALYREAQHLSLDEGDYVIRRRMVQKIEFMSQAAIQPQQPDDNILKAWFEENKLNYKRQSSVTFTHVFVSMKNKSFSEAEGEANLLLNVLNDTGAQYENAPSYGDRFLYHTNYVERTFDYVKSHFGEGAAEFIHSNKTELSKWVGPVLSEHGIHLFFITNRMPGNIPPLEEIRSKVSEDFIREKKRDEVNHLIKAIIKNYPQVIAIEAISSNSESRK